VGEQNSSVIDAFCQRAPRCWQTNDLGRTDTASSATHSMPAATRSDDLNICH